MNPPFASIGSEPNARLWAGVAVAATIILTVIGQMILKWRLNHIEPLHGPVPQQLVRLAGLVLDPYVLCSFFSAFLASLAWMMALSRMDLSLAYPFMSLSFAIVVLLSAWCFSEPLSLNRILGVVVIVIGTMVVARG